MRTLSFLWEQKLPAEGCLCYLLEDINALLLYLHGWYNGIFKLMLTSIY